MSSTNISDYVGYGLAAAIPSSPPVPSGTLATYWATDTSALWGWTGSAWVQMNASGGGTPPSVVQVATTTAPSATTCTFSTAPTAGNMMVAFAFNYGTSAVNYAGWTPVVNFSGSFNGIGWGYRIAGASEPTAQTLVGVGSDLIMWEIANGSPIALFPHTCDIISATVTQAFTTFHANTFFVGCNNCEASATPSGATGATIGGTATTGAQSLSWFSGTATTAGSNSVTLTYGASNRNVIGMLLLG